MVPGRNWSHSLDSVFLAGRVAKDEEPIRPMTLASGGCVTCRHCGDERAVSMDESHGDARVPFFGKRMRGSRCGKRGATAVPPTNCRGFQTMTGWAAHPSLLVISIP